MKDRIEKFAEDHRDDFDNREPAERNWKRISEGISGSEKTLILNSLTFWRVAAFLLLGLSSFLFFNQPSQLGVSSNQVAQQQEFNDIESYYSAQIMEKAALISDQDNFLDDSFTQDIEKLEAMYSVLAEEMKRRPSDKVKDALVLNMLVRIDLLNQHIQKIEDTRKKSTTSSI